MSEKAALAHPAQQRQGTTNSTASADAIPVENGDIGALLVERLQAWKHAVGYLEEYVQNTESVHRHLAKEYEKVLKSVSEPLKEAHHFAQDVGGMYSFFENLRTNTQAISNSHIETEKALKSIVLPTLERLHTEIKDKAKAVRNAAEKGTKGVAKARTLTQGHIELLSSQCGSFDSSGGASGDGKLKPDHDPYILHRGVMHRLHKQVIEENNHKQDLIGVQDQFQVFETYIVQTIQQVLATFFQHVGGQADKQKALYGDIIGAGQRLPADFEWRGFTNRYNDVLIDPTSPNRDAGAIQYPNQNHRSTKPVVEGTLSRKGKIMRSYSSAHYVVTQSKYLHEFKDNDNFSKDPDPEMSLYLPDCTIGALSKAPDAKFNVSGKHVGSSLGGFKKHEYSFKATTHEEASKWHSAISSCAGLKTNDSPLTSPISPTGASGPENLPPVYTRHDTQESGVTKAVPAELSIKPPGAADTVAGGEVVQSPVGVSPVAAEGLVGEDE